MERIRIRTMGTLGLHSTGPVDIAFSSTLVFIVFIAFITTIGNGLT